MCVYIYIHTKKIDILNKNIKKYKFKRIRKPLTAIATLSITVTLTQILLVQNTVAHT